MPSKSAAQQKFMRAVAHNPKFAKKAGVPQKVGKEFADADAALQPPRHKHKGALGDAMRRHHNVKRMQAVRKAKG